jgi:hypothetical protein
VVKDEGQGDWGMVSNKFAFTALGAACIVAAGAGGYFALRQNAPSTVPTPAAVLSQPVQETETVISKAPAASSAAAPTPAKATPAAAPKQPVAAAGRTTSAATVETSRPAKVQTARTDVPAPLDRTWPSGAVSTPSTAQTPSGTPEPAAPPTRLGNIVDRAAQEPPAAAEPPQKTYEELVVSADSVIGLQSETTVTSERARVEDRVEARVTRDVRVGDRVAIPAGARAIGVVSQVERGGKFREHARLAIRFQTVVLADGTRLPVSTDAVVREGSAPSNESAKKIGGGAVAGTILGAILGGAKGAAVGGMAGAGAGTAAVAAGERSAATLRAGEPITVRLLSPVTVTTEK